MPRIKQMRTYMSVDVEGYPASFCLRAGVERRTVPNEVVKHSDQFGRDRDIVAVEEALALARVHQPQRWRFARSGDEQGKAIVDHRGIPNVSAKLLHLEGSEFLIEKGVRLAERRVGKECGSKGRYWGQAGQ